jgi:hypothetical protein
MCHNLEIKKLFVAFKDLSLEFLTHNKRAQPRTIDKFTARGKQESVLASVASSDGQLVQSGISAVHEVIQLPFNVIQQCRSSHSKQMRLRPFIAELVLHQGQPYQGVLGTSDASSGLEADFEICSLKVFTNCANLKYHQPR